MQRGVLTLKNIAKILECKYHHKNLRRWHFRTKHSNI